MYHNTGMGISAESCKLLLIIEARNTSS